MRMYNPPHPGEVLLEDVLPELNMTIKDFADHLGFTREAMSRVLHGKARISTDLAWRLNKLESVLQGFGYHYKQNMIYGK